MASQRLDSGDFLGQPKGLYVLFLTEMWERFSYYGMRVLLIFYLTEHFLFKDSKAILIVGSYNALVNAAPLIGGFLADRYLGFNKAIIAGAILILLGHVGMTFEGFSAYVLPGLDNPVVHRDARAISIMYLSLSFLVIGVGLLKPSISSLLGNLYAHSDPRRESGFIIFIMGINFGAMISAVICGYLGQTFGWSYGFGSAAIAMSIGLVIFLRGRTTFSGHGLPPDETKLKTRIFAFFNYEHLIYLATTVLILMIWRVFYSPQIIGHILSVIAVISSIWLIRYALVRPDRAQRNRLLALLLLLIFFLCYVVLLEQVSTSLNLFIDRNVNRTVGDVTFQASQVYAVLPGMLIVFAPVFAWVWIRLARNGRNPSVPFKFFLGFTVMGLSYYLLIHAVTFTASDNNQIDLIWIVAFFILLAISDLFVVPIAISSVTYLAPKEVLGFMMGIYSFSISSANYLAAMAANTAALTKSDSNEIDTSLSLMMYNNLFMNLALAAIAMSVLLLILLPLIKKLMH